MNTPKIVEVYTDGSCLGNGKPNCKGGIGVHFPEYSQLDIIRPLDGSIQTNNRAELTAVILASEICITKFSLIKCMIHTDSQYVINIWFGPQWIKKWRLNGWKTRKGKVKNLDLIQQLDKLLTSHNYIELRYVKAHSKNKGNDTADIMAKSGATIGNLD